MKIAIVGATGAVGKEILKLLEKRNFPLKSLRLFSSKTLIRLDGIDLAFFCAGNAVSKEWIPKSKCICIDLSSYSREHAPLIIPEINIEKINGARVIASPNCIATILLMPLFSLHRRYKLKRAIVSTYQAASGGGTKLMHKLKQETKDFLEDRPLDNLPYAFNLFPHNSPLHESGYVEEERKILFETRKILEDESILVSATCIRVPVLRAHSISANVEFHHPFSIEEVYAEWRQTKGLKVFEDPLQNRFATPFDATGKEDVYVGRLRIDCTQPNTLEFWAVGDQLLKGAALNAVQIAEEAVKKWLPVRF